MQYPPLPSTLGEDEVLTAFNYFLDSAIAQARSQGLISHGSGSSEVIITGSALCLYNAAIWSDTNPPSALLPHFGGIPRRLHYNTCPNSFIGLFQRWAEIVLPIRNLSEQRRADLKHVICNGPPVPLRPEIYSPAPYLPYMGYSIDSSVHRIAEVLRALAQHISHCRNLRTQHAARFPPNINTTFVNQTWTPPMQESPSSINYPPLQHPTPQTQPGTFPDWPQRASPVAYDPPPSAESTVSYSPASTVVPPGSINEQNRFVGGFAPPQRGATAPEQVLSYTHMPFPSPQHFNASSPPVNNHAPPVDNQRKRNTIADINYPTSGPYNTTSSTDSTITVIGSRTPISEIITQLSLHGCKDLTRSLNSSSFSRPISRGGFGEVYRGWLLDGTQVALKTIFVPEGCDESKHLKHSAIELHTWSKCDHPNVACLLGLAEFKGQLAMVSLWMEHGHLRNYINKNPAVDRLGLSVQMANGLEYLHSIGIVHGDLKGQNVLISDTEAPVLIDFGNSTQSEPTLQFTKTTTKDYMTMKWTAPEIFDGGKSSREADVYALGMEAYTGKVPYSGMSDPAVIKTVANDRKLPDRPPEIPVGGGWGDVLWDLLINCWSYNPSDRPTAKEVHGHLRKISEVAPRQPR